MSTSRVTSRFASLNIERRPDTECSTSRSTADGDDYCVVCMSRWENPKKLSKCGHAFCSDCIDKAFSMIKPVCPICGTVYGRVTGNMPPGTMTVSTSNRSDVPGYPGSGLITIQYRFSDGIQTKEHPHPGKPYHGTYRVAYLPNNSEGRKVCDLLRKAFDARLTFTVGRSATTGLDDQVIWNDIHHKTQISGGPTCFGYPDPTYLNRVQQELASKGIM